MNKVKTFRIFPERFGVYPALFLLYLLMPVFYISREKGLKLAAGYAMLLLFIVAYRQLYFSIGKKAFTYWLVIQTAIIVCLSLFYYPYHLFMGFFTANFVGWYSSKATFRTALLCFIATIVLLFIANIPRLGTNEMLIISVFVLVMIASPFGIRSMNSRAELEKKLDQANEQIKDLVKREERMRIARDLHDTLGHTLSLITLKSQLVGKLVVKNPEQAVLEAKEIELTSRSALKQVRELVSDMRAVTVAEEIIEVRAILEAAGIQFQFEGDMALDDVPHLSQNIVSLCMREAVTNVVKHSRATCCSVRIERSHGEVSVTIKDNGIGAAIQDAERGGNGLKGIGERLALIEGTFSLQGEKGKGTVLTILVPIIMTKEGTAS